MSNLNELNIKGELVYIPTDKLYPHPDNPRKELGDLTELAESIKSKGVMQNLTVVPKGSYEYTVIIGHRRLGASKIAGLTELPCVIAEMTKEEQVATMLMENMQRSDLTVYEQAQGFQMMFDFGVSQADIAGMTGLSKATVSRRMKLLSLDKKKFESAEQRGGTLEDYIKVAEIKDDKERDKVTDAIGTSNFNWKLKDALEKQNLREMLPLIKQRMKELGISKNDKIYGYDGVHEQVASAEVATFKEKQFKGQIKDGVEYWWNIQYGRTVYIYKKKDKQKKEKVKKSPKELKAIESRKQLEKLTETAYECRKQFVSEFTACKKNAEIINNWLWDLQYDKLTYTYGQTTGWELLCEKIDEPEEKYTYYVKKENLMRFMQENPSNAPIVIAHALAGDTRKLGYYESGFGETMPSYSENAKLDKIYKYLCLLGYEMSDVEKDLQNGTHELFKGGESK